ncbi:LysR family transcriptional regulator [Jiella endophytica]|nr:LysR family transcriptional regulator [Jiella endophytica]
MMLDPESVRLFVMAADYGNLTRAAEAAGTVQPVVSQRIKALKWDDHEPPTLALGISDHALGTAFDGVLRRLQGAVPARTPITVRLGQSAEVRSLYESGTVDLAIIRREANAGDGEILGEDPLAWRVPEGWTMPSGPVPIVSLPPPCGVRAVASRALDHAGLAWRDAFVGGSCLALVAAVRAGLGIAPLGRLVGGGLATANSAHGLPDLPSSKIVLLARTSMPAQAAAGRALAASVREALK